MLKPLPTNTATFRDIINGDFLYIDKTEYIYHVVHRAKGAFFLSRPRRFGKSLLISTLEELFDGKRELFDAQRFANYWFESGTPTFLIKLLHQQNYNIERFDDLQVEELALSTFDIERLAIVPLLFQTGYLTIKSYDPQSSRYELYYPNYEVENAFLTLGQVTEWKVVAPA